MESLSVQRPRVPIQITNAIDVLVGRAKASRNGVFWTLGAHHRQTNPTQLENSLGYGTPGVLLGLLEYYRCTQNKDIGELIVKGLDWVTHKSRIQQFWHGFYAGTSGTWFLYKQAEEAFPGALGTWKKDAVLKIKDRSDGDCIANLAFGIAGTIVGALAGLGLEPVEKDELIQSLLSPLIAATKPAPLGVFWDFNPTSFRPPTGFLIGNAGIDYCLAQLHAQLGVALSSILRGSLAYADSLFDPKTGNWPDQDATERFKQLKPAEIEKALKQGKLDTVTNSIRPEDSPSWSVGAAGMLLSRLTVYSNSNDEHIRKRALEGCRWASQRLHRETQEDLAKFDSSLATGLGGLISVLKDCHLMLPEGEAASLDTLSRNAIDVLNQRTASVIDDDVSLLTGVAGTLYAQCRSLTNPDTPDCLNPLGILPRRAAERITAGDLEPLYKRRIPAAASVPEVRAALSASTASLNTINAALTTQYQKEPASVLTKSIQHEIKLYEMLSTSCFQALFWREAANRRRTNQIYSEGINSDLLFERFQINKTVTLLNLDYDPYTRTQSQSRVFILRQATSLGVSEVTLSGLQHGLLVGFSESAVAVEVIRNVVQQVETPGVTPRQLAELCRKMIRSFLQNGILVADPSNKLGAWIDRKRLEKTRNNLFPSSKA